MALQKNFLKPSIKTLPIPRWQWILLTVVHLSLAFSFYLFCLYVKESYKVVHFDTYSPLTIEMQYEAMPSTFGFKFCFAFFSLLFAQQFFLFNIFIRPSFHKWFPQLKTKILRIRKVHLINNNRLLQNAGLYFLFSLFLMLYAYGYDYWIMLYLQNELLINLTFILLLIVLYFQQWLTIMRYFKNVKKWQWIVLSLNIGVAILFTLPPAQEVDKYYADQLKRAFTVNYDIEFIKTENAEKAERLSLVEEAMLAYPRNEKSDKPHFQINNYDYYKANVPSLTMDDFSRYITNAKDSKSEAERHFLTFNFTIGLNVEMKHVYELQRRLREQGSFYMNYHVASNLENMIVSSPLNIGEKLIPPCKLTKNEPNRLVNNIGCFYILNCSEIKLSSYRFSKLEIKSNKIFINEENILLENLKSKLLDLLNNPKNLLEIRIDDNTHFEYYLKTLDALKSIRKQLRDEYAQQMFQRNFEYLNESEERSQINNKLYEHFYPIKLTPKEWEYYDFLKR